VLGNRKPFDHDASGAGGARPSTATTSVEAARLKLGGSAVPSARPAGALVQAVLRDGASHVGAVLWASERRCDVWFDDGVARRVGAASVTPYDGPLPDLPDPLVRVAAEIRLFAAMSEGDRVLWTRADRVLDGRIVEKCRYGAIVVATGTGRLVAVGFRKLWPAAAAAVA